MKITSIEINNVGKVRREIIPFNKPLLLFYGEVMQGKTTILNSVRLCFGGPYPQDLITHGQTSASVVLRYTGGSITREFYRDPEDDKVKAHKIKMLVDNNPRPVTDPFDRIRAMVNPFLLDQHYLENMGETDRQKYFVKLLDIDTREEDAELTDLKDQIKALDHKIAGYGEIDLTEVLPMDSSGLRRQLADARAAHTAKVAKCNKELDGLRQQETVTRGELKTIEAQIEVTTGDIDVAAQRIENLESQLHTAKARHENLLKSRQASQRECERLRKELSTLPDVDKQEAEIKARRDTPLDTGDLEQQIAEAAAQDVRVQEYQKRVQRDQERAKDNRTKESASKRVKELQQAKAAKLEAISESSGIPGLGFDEDGNFIFEDTTAGMISGSQMARLSSMIQERLPNELGIQLVDQGESLGKAIFGYIDRAKERNTTILCTVVGERPAKVPDEAAVYVVDDGKLMP